MPEPISEQIRQSFMTFLGTVQTLAADTTTKTLTVEAVSRYGNSTNDLETSVELGMDKWLEEDGESTAVGQDAYEQEYLVFVNIQTPDNALPTPTPDFDQRFSNIVADVRKAMMTAFDGGALPFIRRLKPRGFDGGTRGAMPFTNKGGEVGGVIIPFTAMFFTTLNNPYSQ